MKRVLFCIFGLFSMVAANAAPFDVSGLTDEQQAQLALQAAQMRKNENTTLAAIIKDPETAEAWSKTIGTIIKTTATELGIAVNEFANTSVGKLTIALVVWKVLGNGVVHVVLGISMFIVLFPCWFYFFRRMCVIKRIVESEKDGKKTKEVFFYDDGSDVEGTRFIMLLVLCGLIGTCITITFVGW